MYSDYSVYSNFTWAFFEDSGFYKVNYSFVALLNEHQFDLIWGKGIQYMYIFSFKYSQGLGCDFVLGSCDDFPYSCSVEGEQACTFDHLSKVITDCTANHCIVYL